MCMDVIKSFLDELSTPNGLQVKRTDEQQVKIMFKNNSVVVREQPDGLYIQQKDTDMYTQRTAQETAEIVKEILIEKNNY